MVEKIAVYGLGHLGMPLATVLARAGFDVVGVDPVSQRGYLEPDLDDMGSIECFNIPQESDVSFIVVPTPSLEGGEFDNMAVYTALHQISEVNAPRHTAVIVSTVSPGTCDRLAIHFQQLSIVYNPTFIALGSVVKGLTCPDMILIGTDDALAANQVASIWSEVVKTTVPMHTRDFLTVELLKLSVNTALGIKISMANSLGQLFKAYGVSPAEVEVIGWDHRIGQDLMTPGSPITGPCLPRDQRALQAAGDSVGVTLPISDAVETVNQLVLETIYDNVMAHEPDTVGILGWTYKHGTDVITDAIGPWLNDELPVKCLIYDHVLTPEDALDGVLSCDVVVITQRELRPLAANSKAHIIDVWA